LFYFITDSAEAQTRAALAAVNLNQFLDLPRQSLIFSLQPPTAAFIAAIQELDSRKLIAVNRNLFLGPIARVSLC
jgi:hypothetical protein